MHGQSNSSTPDSSRRSPPACGRSFGSVLREPRSDSSVAHSPSFIVLCTCVASVLFLSGLNTCAVRARWVCRSCACGACVRTRRAPRCATTSHMSTKRSTRRNDESNGDSENHAATLGSAEGKQTTPPANSTSAHAVPSIRTAGALTLMRAACTDSRVLLFVLRARCRLRSSSFSGDTIAAALPRSRRHSTPHCVHPAPPRPHRRRTRACSGTSCSSNCSFASSLFVHFS